MPKKDDELMALADVYADALLQAADEKGEAERVAAEFADLIRYLDRDRDFERFLTASSVDDDPRRDSLEKLFRGRMSDLLLNLLQVLNNRGRLDLVRVVYRAVQLRMERRHHQQEVVVETAMALTDDLRQAIVKHVGEYIGKEPLLIERVVPELIGGVVIRINDIQIDGSVSSRIRTLRQKFSRRAVVEIPSGRGVEL
ncbi:MAG TPA: ATP synthase F1 subunit delta [Phycisphaerae bacterium]|nr:ATP synthase F1 subunit delta [Phycisphaerae bacterium]HOJ74796.1 ATP synthase F1 subunit delta [Phycisphaerae bacterium]HOM51959.1 ATP synthase F1 subunit delta [Phycisphaerae bacterium]HOQ85648.1 ATP synthase F1 subunit delta [Phycisphaerae bacterium]HPP27417.1 ATP synthase F1 subunit delta [Phycisphaerae bacterium]